MTSRTRLPEIEGAPPRRGSAGVGNAKVILVSRCAWTLFNYRSGLIRALCDRGSRVLAGGAADDGFGPQVEALGARFRPLPVDRNMTSVVGDLRLFVTLVRWYRRERPEVVHHFTVKPAIYGSIAARLAGVPCVVATVTGLGHPFLANDRPWLRRLVEGLYWVALTCAHRVFFHNRDDRRLFIERGLVSESRSELLPGSGVDCVRFSPDTCPRGRAGPPARVLLPARLLREKGVYEFVEAARRVKEQLPGTCFEIIGRRDERNPSVVPAGDLRRWQAEGIVAWRGEVADVRPALAESDVVVLPSYREGVPRALLEAAAMGKPVITTDTAGCRDVVEDGRTGLLVPVGDGPALARAIVRLVSDSEACRTMGAAGREKVLREFDERTVIARILDEYAGILSARRNPERAGRRR